MINRGFCRSFLPTLFLLAWTLAFGLRVAHADWRLCWGDEFNGNSIDPTHWKYDLGTGPPFPGWGNHELQTYTTRPQNAFVTNGLLHIVAVQESYQGAGYTSARLKSSGLFNKSYGRFEFRARLPQGAGYWPALWLMPQKPTYGGWAASGEIDVMENHGDDPSIVLGTIHFGGSYPKNTRSSGPSYHFPAGDSVTNFHIYAVEWMTNTIRWYVDEHLYETQNSWWSSSNRTNTMIRNPAPAPFDQPFYIVMNLAVGGDFGGNPDGSTFFPGELQVDYVRVYDFVAAQAAPPEPRLRFALEASPENATTSSETNRAGRK